MALFGNNAAGTPSVCTRALGTFGLILRDLQTLEEQPEAIIRLGEALQTACGALRLLKLIEDPVWNQLDAHVAKRSKSVLVECTEICNTIGIGLQQRKHRPDDVTLRKRDRRNDEGIRLLEINAMSDLLHSCALLVKAIVKTVNV